MPGNCPAVTGRTRWTGWPTRRHSIAPGLWDAVVEGCTRDRPDPTARGESDAPLLAGARRLSARFYGALRRTAQRRLRLRAVSGSHRRRPAERDPGLRLLSRAGGRVGRADRR